MYDFRPEGGLRMDFSLQKQVTELDYLNSEIDCAYHEIAVKLGLADSVMITLCILRDFEGECPLSEIIRLSGLSKQTVNSALRRLEEKGVVVLKPLQGKKKNVCLTPSGKIFADSTAGRMIQMENEIWASWTEQERTTYLELTRRFLSALREKTGSL